MSAALDWVAGEGFEEFFGRYRVDGFDYGDAHEFRQRYLIRALAKRTI